MLEDIEKEVLAWHRETFPNATDSAVVHKLKEESNELYEAVWYCSYYGIDKDEIPAEIADVAIVSIALLSRMNTSLSAVIAAKLAVNKARTWGPETENGDRKRVK